MQSLVRDNWERFANIRFEFTTNTATPAEIRVDFDNGKSHSCIGTYSLFDYPIQPPTMQLHFTCETLEYATRVVLHEFAHCLGILHEHQRVCSPVNFNMPNLEKKIQGDWDTVQKDYLRFPSTASIDPFPYDVKSITHYGFIASLLRDGKAIPERPAISKKDKAYIAYLCPKPCGGTIDLGEEPMFYTISGDRHVLFDALQKSVPRVVLGITSMS